jgi:DNA-binding transcriptional MerR regulator
VTSAPQAAAAYLSIGEVLSQLQADYPDVTISKIRFLESEGLVEPARTPSGYRKFSRADVARLRYVLSAQRDHYLPLRVIREHLDALDRGLEPGPPGAGPTAPRALVSADPVPLPAEFGRSGEMRLSRPELLTTAGLSEDQLDQLEQYGLIASRSRGGHYDADAVLVASVVAELSRYGIEARHLRAFKAAAEREIGLVEQVVSPLFRQRTPDARARADEVARELATLCVRLHAALVKAGLRVGLAG